MIASRPGRAWSVAGSIVTSAAAALIAVALSACSAGQITQTGSDVAAVPGANANAGTDGEIALRNLVIAYNGPRGYAAGSSAALVVRIFNNGLRTIRLTGVSAGEAARGVVLLGAGGSPTPTSPPASSPSPAPTSASPSSGPSGSPGAEPSGTPPPSAPTGSAPSESTSPTPSSPDETGTGNFAIPIAASSYVLLVPGLGPYLRLVGLTKPITPGTSVNVTFTFDDGSSAVVAVPVGPPPSPLARASAVWSDSESAN